MKWTHALAAAPLGILAAVAITSSSNATTMIRMDDADLALLADAVVVARVDDVRVIESRGMHYTEIVLDVEEAWKGEIKAPSYITVRTLGGQLAGKRALVAGTAIFLKNETTLLYLERNVARGEWSVLGWMQGKFTVLEKADGTQVVRQIPLKFDHSGLDVDDPKVEARLQVLEAATPLVERRAAFERVLMKHEADGGGDPWKLKKYQGIGR